MENIITEKCDLLHEVIFEISENVQGIKFPIERVVNYLLSEAYIIKNSETTKTAYILYKEGRKTVVTSNFISFEKLGQIDRERYKQNFYTYIISRSKIYFQSAEQNVKAAKINLIQNQRRTCVSNMYYALHNSFASLVEFYKSEKLINMHLLDEESNNDEETKLEHFIPRALKALVTNIDDILISEKEEYIINTKMDAGRVKSHENPFAWIFPLFSNCLEDETFKEIINSMSDALKNVNLDNFGVENISRRSGFENQLKENLIIIREISKEEGINTQKVLYLEMAAFLAYAYMLRQSADYDSLFEIKIPHQDIINWTIITANFLNFVTKYVREENAQSNERIQKLDAASSIEILRTHDTDSKSTIMTMTGIIIDKEFDLVQIIKELYSQKGYKMVNQRGRIVELNNTTEMIGICRILFGTPLECFISFSNQGLFRIDIVLKDEINDTEFSKGVNQYYLEQLIQTDVIEKDLLSVVSKSATIVRGIPTTLQHSSLNYLDLVVGVHERIGRNIQSSLSRHLRDVSSMYSTENYPIICLFSMNNNGPGFMFRVRHELERNINNSNANSVNDSINKLLFIYFSPNSFQNKSELETKGTNYINNNSPQIDSKFEFIQMSETEVRQVIEKDYSFLDLIVTNLKEKHENIDNNEIYKTTNFDNPNLEMNEDGIEDFVEDMYQSVSEKILTKEANESPVEV